MAASPESAPIRWDHVDTHVVKNRATGLDEIKRVTFTRGDHTVEGLEDSTYVQVRRGTNQGIMVYEPDQPHSKDTEVMAWPTYIAEASCAARVSVDPPRYQFVHVNTSFPRDEAAPSTLEVFEGIAQIAGQAAITAARAIEEFHTNK